MSLSRFMFRLVGFIGLSMVLFTSKASAQQASGIFTNFTVSKVILVTAL